MSNVPSSNIYIELQRQGSRFYRCTSSGTNNLFKNNCHRKWRCIMRAVLRAQLTYTKSVVLNSWDAPYHQSCTALNLCRSITACLGRWRSECLMPNGGGRDSGYVNGSFVENKQSNVRSMKNGRRLLQWETFLHNVEYLIALVSFLSLAKCYCIRLWGFYIFIRIIFPHSTSHLLNQLLLEFRFLGHVLLGAF